MSKAPRLALGIDHLGVADSKTFLRSISFMGFWRAGGASCGASILRQVNQESLQAKVLLLRAREAELSHDWLASRSCGTPDGAGKTQVTRDPD